MPTDETAYESALFAKLRGSELFITYQDAFRSATGLPLRFVGAELDEWCLDENHQNRSSFCEALNLCRSTCGSCIATNRRLMEEAAVKGPTTCECFSGMAATAVPVRAGDRLVGFLKTGQVFTRVPEPGNFSKVARILTRQGLAAEHLEMLETAYRQTRKVEPQRYQSMITLLSTFARQLGQHADKIVAVTGGAEPVAVTKAREFIRKNLAEPLPLALVARKAGLSESHFCRVFREVTSMTLTDYVNHCRVEWAKRELLNGESRISEIAFLIGYQSLSQFNRSFTRFTGRSPSSFRREELAQLSS